jgi:hypothetical protein
MTIDDYISARHFITTDPDGHLWADGVWHVLSQDQTITPQDWYYMDGRWTPSGRWAERVAGIPIRELISNPRHGAAVCELFARRGPAPTWIRSTDRRPEQGSSVWIFVTEEGQPRFVGSTTPSSWITVTHWMPAENNTNPPPNPTT